MTVTYGEHMLAQAEAAVRRRSTRRRTWRLLVPFLIASLWSIADLSAARGARLSIGGAGSFRITFDHALVVGWGLAFVVVPMVAALKREPLTSGAALSLVAGPVATPLLFGAGGWKWWQSLVVIAIAALVIASSRTRHSAR